MLIPEREKKEFRPSGMASSLFRRRVPLTSKLEGARGKHDENISTVRQII